MPWGPLAITENMPPTDSDDGPIFWTRPGEQLIRTDGERAPTAAHRRRLTSRAFAELKDEPRVKNRASRKAAFSTRPMERRELLFEDRTPCHADHVGDGLERHTTAAVGVLQGVRAPDELNG